MAQPGSELGGLGMFIKLMFHSRLPRVVDIKEGHGHVVSLCFHNASNSLPQSLRQREKCGLEMVVTDHAQLKCIHLSLYDLRSEV